MMTENNGQILEKIEDKQLLSLDKLTLSQRFLFYQMLFLVKDGYTSKINYKMPFKKIKEMQIDLFKLKIREYTLKDFLADFQVLAEKQFCFFDAKDKKRQGTYLTNLNIDHDRKIVRYNFCKDMGKICASYKGKNFMMNILDFAALELKASRRILSYLNATAHKVDVVRQIRVVPEDFSGNEPMNGEDFLETVINPAVEELNQKILFTFKDITAKMIFQEKEPGKHFIEIGFVRKKPVWKCRVCLKYNPKLIDSKKYKLPT